MNQQPIPSDLSSKVSLTSSLLLSSSKASKQSANIPNRLFLTQQGRTVPLNPLIRCSSQSKDNNEVSIDGTRHGLPRFAGLSTLKQPSSTTSSSLPPSSSSSSSIIPSSSSVSTTSQLARTNDKKDQVHPTTNSELKANSFGVSRISSKPMIGSNNVSQSTSSGAKLLRQAQATNVNASNSKKLSEIMGNMKGTMRSISSEKPIDSNRLGNGLISTSITANDSAIVTKSRVTSIKALDTTIQPPPPPPPPSSSLSSSSLPPSSSSLPTSSSAFSSSSVSLPLQLPLTAAINVQHVGQQKSIAKSTSSTENFVRRNLKRKFGNYKKPRSSAAMSRRRGGHAEDSDDSTDSTYDGNPRDNSDMVTTDSSAVTDMVSSVQHQNDNKRKQIGAGGLQGFGVDAVSLVLRSLSSESNIKPTAYRNREHLRSAVRGSGMLSMQPRGLLSRAQRKSARVSKVNARYGGYSDDSLREMAPNCSGHGLACKLLKVKKDGPNKGRKFYACSFPKDQRCDYFVWAEDNPDLISILLQQDIDRKAVEAAMSPSEVRIVGFLQAFEDKLQEFTVEELRAEVRASKRRRQLWVSSNCEYESTSSTTRTSRANRLEYKSLPPLKSTGSRMELVQTLLLEAKRVLELNESNELPNGVDNCCNKSIAAPVPPLPQSGTECLGESTIVFSDSDENDSFDDVKQSNLSLESSKKSADCSAASASSSNNFGEMTPKPVVEAKSEFCEMDLNENPLEEDSEDEDETDDDDCAENDEGDENDYDDEVFDADNLSETSSESHDRKSIENKLMKVVLRNCFGFSSFRPGQSWACEQALRGHRSLVVMPTGAGKTICYMLPARMLPGLTIVISPLVALMEDQVRKLPVELPGACLSSHLSVHQTTKLTSALLKGMIKILFVSPERLCTHSFRQLIRSIRSSAHYSAMTQPISLVCIDEAHCMSQWSYNFRPSFFRISNELEILQPRALLALTATATPAVQADICSRLGIDNANIFACTSPRTNLHYSGSSGKDDDAKRQAIVKYLRGEGEGADRARLRAPKSSVPLTIVYVSRRNEAESLCEYLTAAGLPALAYHAGMDTEQRHQLQLRFLRGSVRIIVATVAFGMGIDKADVRRVVHYSVPSSIESYMQETGRAGRDGERADCHLLLCGNDFIRMLSQNWSQRLCLLQTLSAVSVIFSDDDNLKGNDESLSGSTAIDIEQLAVTLDTTAAVLETLLTMLEMPPFGFVKLEGVHFSVVEGQFRMDINSGSTSDHIKRDPLVQAIIRHRQVSIQDGISSRQVPNCEDGDDSEDDISRYGFLFGSGTMRAPNGAKSTSQWSLRMNEKGSSLGTDLKFTVDLTALMRELHLTRDELTYGLYSLQKREIIAYKLLQPKMFLKRHARDQSPLMFSSVGSRHEWLNSLALQLTSLNESMDASRAEKVCRMWLLGLTVVNSNDSQQEIIHNTLAQYLKEETMTPTNAISVEENFVFRCAIPEENPSQSSHRIVNYFELPVLPQAREDMLLADIKMLYAHPRMQTLIKNQLMECGQLIAHNDLTDSTTESEIMSLRLGLASLLISRCLHALPTRNLSWSEWKDETLWGRYRDIDFQSLVPFAANILAQTT